MPGRLVMRVVLERMRPGVPAALQVVVAVEAADILGRVQGTGLTASVLDDAAEAGGPSRAVLPRPPLLGYAAQLAGAGEHTEQFAGELELLPPSRLLGRWRLAAFDAGLELEQWVSVMLGLAPAGAVRWEAAAAAEGLTLTEWVLLQALSA